MREGRRERREDDGSSAIADAVNEATNVTKKEREGGTRHRTIIFRKG